MNPYFEGEEGRRRVNKLRRRGEVEQ